MCGIYIALDKRKTVTFFTRLKINNRLVFGPINLNTVGNISNVFQISLINVIATKNIKLKIGAHNS